MEGGERQIPHPPRSLPLLRAREPRPDGRDHHGTRRHRRTLTPRSRSRVRHSHAEATHAHTGDEHDHDHGADVHEGEHEDHGAHTDHSGHERMFRRRFWVSLALSVPVIFQRVHSGCLRLHSADVPRKRLDHAGSFGDHLRVRWRAVPPRWPGRNSRTASRG